MRRTPHPLVAVIALLAACAAPARQSARLEAPARVAPVRDAGPPAPGAPDALATGRLPDLARPVSYALELDVDPARERFSGTQRIELDVLRATRGLVLHAREIDVRSATIHWATGAAPLRATASSRPAAGGRGAPEELVLSFPGDVPAGRATLEIAFDAAFARGLRGLYRARVGDAWYAYTQFEPNDARRAFPCFDEPGFKVPWTVSLLVPEAMTAVANMPEASRAPRGEGRVRVAFQPTPPTPSYLVAFAVGTFDIVEGARTPIPIRAITTRGQGSHTRAILDAAAAHVAILGEYFDRPFPYPKLDLVAVPEFGAGAMENPGLITFREELMLVDADHAPTRARRSMAVVLAHELAHHWFGDLVTMAWWNDLWLNEAFATWMQSRVVDRWRPAFGARLESLRGRSGAMEQDALPAARAIRQPVTSTSDAVEAFDWITYVKGGAVLGMLESWLGEETFRAGMRDYVRAHAWGNATGADLFAALGRASNRDVAAVAATFTDQPGVPLVRVEVQCPHPGTPRIVLAQSQYRPIGPAAAAAAAGDPRRWQIPVCVRYDNGPAPGRECVLLTEAQQTATLQGATRCPRWVYPNADEAGYYRYAITPQVRAIAQRDVLRATDAVTRAGYVDNAFALVRANELGVDEYLALLEGFRAERDRGVVETIAGNLAVIHEQIADEALRPRLRAWIAGFFRPIARELGWDARPNDDDDRRLLRRSALGMMGLAEDPATLAEAERRAVAYLADRRSVDPDLASFAVPLASRRAGGDRLDAIVAALRANPSAADRVTLVAAMGAFDDPVVLRRALELTLTDTVRVQDMLRVVGAAVWNSVRRPAALAWLHERFDALQTRLQGDTVGRLAGVVGGACTAEQLREEREWWIPRVARYEGAERALREGTQRAEQCVAFRGAQRERLATALGGRAR